MVYTRLRPAYSEFVTQDGHSLLPLDWDSQASLVQVKDLVTGEKRWIYFSDFKNLTAYRWAQPEVATVPP